MNPTAGPTKTKLLSTKDKIPFWQKQDLIELPFVIPLLYRPDRKYLDRWPGGERYSPDFDRVARELRAGLSCLIAIDSQDASRERPRVRILMGQYEIYATVSTNRDNSPRLWLSGIYFASNQRRATYCARALRASIEGIDLVEGSEFGNRYESATSFYNRGEYVTAITKHASSLAMQGDLPTQPPSEQIDETESLNEERVLNTLQTFVDAEYELEQLAARARGSYAYTQFRPEPRKSILRRFYRVKLTSSDYARLLQDKPSMLSIALPSGEDLPFEVSTLQPTKGNPEIVVSTNRQLSSDQLPNTGELRPVALPTLRNVRSDVISRQRARNSINSWLVPLTAGHYVPQALRPAGITLQGIKADSLNVSQRRAVVAGAATPDLSLVLGPPGTGKTTVISSWVQHFIASGLRVLVTSQNNKAVDNVLERLARIKDLVLVRIGNEEKTSSSVSTLLIDNVATELQQRLTVTLSVNHEALIELIRSLGKFATTIGSKQTIDLATAAQLYAQMQSSLAHHGVLSPLCLDEFMRPIALLRGLQRLHEDATALDKSVGRMQSKTWWIRVFLFISIAIKRAQLTAMRKRLASGQQQLTEQTRLAIANAGKKLQAFAKQMTRWADSVSKQNQEAMYDVLLSTVDVVGATCIGINTQRLFRETHFDVVIIDEAGQIQLHNLIVPLSRAPRAILVGDHKQLPPVVANELTDEVQSRLGNDSDALGLLKKSWFEWLWDRIPTDRKHRLDTQFRCPRVISDFISEAFYEKQYFAGPGMDKKAPLLSCFKSPLVVIDTSGLENRFEQARRTDNREEVVGNTLESSIVLSVLQRALSEKPELVAAPKDENGACEVAIIAPYRHHVTELQRLISKSIMERRCPDPGIPLGELVATVDSFQGQERDLIIMVFTRSNKRGDIGFLADWRRLNVAMTRTKQQLVMIGDFSTIAQAPRQGRRDTEFKTSMRLLSDYVDRHGQRIDARHLERTLNG